MIKTSGVQSVFSSTLFGGMVIFDDPAYIIVAIIGATIAMISAYKGIIKSTNDTKYERITIVMELIKTFTIGLIISLLSFLVLVNYGDILASKYLHISRTTALPSIWLTITLVISSLSIALYNRTSKAVTDFKTKNNGRDL